MSINSDSKQCTELKLSWVHSVHTQGPGCAHWALSRRVAGRHASATAPYRHTARYCAVSRHKGRPPATIQKIVSRHTPVASALPLAPARRLGRVAVLLAVSLHLAMCPNTPTRSYRAPAPLPIVIQSTVSRPKTGKWAVAHPAASCKFFF